MATLCDRLLYFEKHWFCVRHFLKYANFQIVNWRRELTMHNIIYQETPWWKWTTV